ncbi:hypothetical protein AeRB84_011619 [Aphanomyces euteiches]|nr:hypothetical protein AeRB84_011619 [Aphanomyces euteiches]
MSALDDEKAPPDLPSPLTTHINHIPTPTACHSAFFLQHSPDAASKKLPFHSPRSTYTPPPTEEDVHFERYMDETTNPSASPLDHAVKWSVQTMRRMSFFSAYGNTFVSASMVQWTMQITVIHIALLISLFIFTPELKKHSYVVPSNNLSGQCDDTVSGIQVTVYAGLSNIVLCLPTTHLPIFDLYTVHNRKSWIHTLCELIVIAEIVFLVYKISVDVYNWYTRALYIDCFRNDMPSDLKVKLIVILVLDLYVYVACWYQITLFNRMRDVALGQRNVLTKNHLFEFTDPDWFFFRFVTDQSCRALIKRGLYEAAAKGDERAVDQYIREATKLVGPEFPTKWYSNRLYCKHIAFTVRNPLHVAVIKGRMQVVRKLLKAGFDPNALDKIQTPSLHLTQIYQRIFNVLVFLRSTNFSESTSASADRYGPKFMWSQVLLTPLHLAMIHTESAIVSLLLEFGADPNLCAVSNQRKYAVPPIFFSECHMCLQSLLSAGANLLFIPGNGYFMTPYEVVLLNGNFNLANVMVDWGADIALTPLHAAAADGDWKTVGTFLDSGISPDILGEHSSGRFHRTPLHWAAIRGQTQVVKLLLVHQCDPDPADVMGMTPLAWACIYNHDAVVELLLQAHADVHMTDTRGRALISILATFDTKPDRPRDRVLRLLRDYGCNLHARCENTGETALHIALKLVHIGTAKELVQMGLDVTAIDFTGVRAIDCATSSDIQYAIKKAAGQRDVMISYCHSHRGFATKVRQSLEDRYITTWIDQLDPTGIGGGSEWREEIARGILGASVVLAVLSEDYPQSQWCMKELAFAKQHNIPVVGIMCGNVVVGDELEVYLWTRQSVDFRPSIVSTTMTGKQVVFEYNEEQYEVHVRQLIDGLRDEIEERRVALVKDTAVDTSRLSGASSAMSAVASVFTSDSYVFLTHGDCHLSFANQVKDELKAAGFNVKMDHPGSNRQIVAKDAILDPHCIALAVVLSDSSTKSEVLRDQIAFAENRCKPIVPILLSSQTLDLALVYSLSRSTLHHFNESIGFKQSMDSLLPNLRQLHRRSNQATLSPSNNHLLRRTGSKSSDYHTSASPLNSRRFHRGESRISDNLQDASNRRSQLRRYRRQTSSLVTDWDLTHFEEAVNPNARTVPLLEEAVNPNARAVPLLEEAVNPNARAVPLLEEPVQVKITQPIL